jgi:hypothetical protein
MKRSDVPIPPKLRMRPKDPRGYPIPYIVTVDLEGSAFFILNDAEKVHLAISRGLCGLCGTKLEFDRWVIGGAGAAFHEQGAYLDPPVHHDCGEYALRVCPFLATSYSRRLEMKGLRDIKMPLGYKIAVDEDAIPQQPPFYVFAKTANVTRWPQGPGVTYFVPKRPFQKVEFWKHGERITAADAERLLSEDVDTTFSKDDLKHWQES